MKQVKAPLGCVGFKADHSGSEELMLPAFPKGTVVRAAQRSDFILPSGDAIEGKKTCGKIPNIKVEAYKFADLTPGQAKQQIWVFVYDKASQKAVYIIKTTYGEVAAAIPEASKELGRCKIRLGARDDTRLTGRFHTINGILMLQFPQPRPAIE